MAYHGNDNYVISMKLTWIFLFFNGASWHGSSVLPLILVLPVVGLAEEDGGRGIVARVVGICCISGGHTACLQSAAAGPVDMTVVCRGDTCAGIVTIALPSSILVSSSRDCE